MAELTDKEKDQRSLLDEVCLTLIQHLPQPGGLRFDEMPGAVILLAGERNAAKAILKDIQWCKDIYLPHTGAIEVCPVCDGAKPAATDPPDDCIAGRYVEYMEICDGSVGHDEKCELGTMLREDKED